MTEMLVRLIGKSATKMYLKVWPPYGENRQSDIDTAACFSFVGESNEVVGFTTDQSDLTTLCVFKAELPRVYFNWPFYKTRMQKWMQCDLEEDIDTEFYAAHESHLFGNIIDAPIKRIDYITVGEEGPIGLRLQYENDYLLSFPNIDGNTIKTRHFNKDASLSAFENLGRVELVNILDYRCCLSTK